MMRSSLSSRRASRGACLSLAMLSLCAACSSSRDASVKEELAPDAPTLVDVGQLELHRAPPRELSAALAPAASDEVRARAALALARLEHVDAAPLLFQAARDPTVVVRKHAAFGLGQLDLALEPGREVHDEVRRGVESFLLSWLSGEKASAVRLAILRALGRVSFEAGLAYLLEAASTGSERAPALYALGVSGARRSSSLSSDKRLLGVVEEGLKDADVEVRRAAAYAAFRQQLPLSAEALKRAAAEPDAATRIHLARAMKDVTGAPTAAVPLLPDPDWRVRVEALRALASQAARGGELPVASVRDVGLAAAKRLLGGAWAEGHVVAAACDALSDPQLPLPPEELRAAVDAVLAALPASAPDIDAVRCRCAVAADALALRSSAVQSCAPSWSVERVKRLEVQVASRARLSSRERTAWLARAIDDSAVAVRVQAAWALVEDGSRHAAVVAAERLEKEEDPATAGALLQLFTAEHAAELSDVTLARIVDRFYRAEELEDMEPLLVAATLLRGRLGAPARDAADMLRRHSEPRLRELVDEVPHGERAHGPRARTDAPPPRGEMPLAAILKTQRGDIHLAFERELAPVATWSFVSLARRGFFDGVVFHRVVPDFVSQGGDPRGDGSGGPGYHIPCENSDEPYQRGVVGMALAGKDTGGSQFFLTHSEQPHLDGRYTIFARVTSGLEVMDALMPDDRILKVEFAGAVPARGAAR